MKNLIASHASETLKPLLINDSSQRDAILQQSTSLSQLLLNSAAAANTVMLGAGYFTTLNGFMDKKDAIRVANNMVTTDGLFWPVPIINLTEDIGSINESDEIALLDPNVDGTPVIATQKVESIEVLTDSEMLNLAEKIFGTTDNKHPGVSNFLNLGNILISGPIKVLNYSYFPKDDDHMMEFNNKLLNKISLFISSI